VTINRNTQRTIRRNGNTFTRNDNSTFSRKTPNRYSKPHSYSRPRNERSHHRQKGKSVRLYSHVVGRRPGRIFNRVIWPRYVYPIYYSYGRRHYIHYVRPRYHRKYIFFSIGSYWPAYYTSVRYYWYGSHVYRWYGCYPTAYSVGGDTYNYYTYNTYNTNTAAPTTYTDAAPLDSVDHTTFEDIREKLDEQNQQQPDAETLADKFFEDGVNAFEKQDYDAAAAAFADAIALDPDDLILPFAYVQALFASEQYFKAADILRFALEQMPADQQGLFFPRGLYAEDEILFEQIEKLQTRAETFSYDPDLPLLLGYQLIGIEQHENARKWLDRAAQYDLNENSTNILNELLDKLQEQPEQTPKSL
jgi:tetratricopeptide (TPR) repeat protein